MKYFSVAKRGFYLEEMKRYYEDAGSWPDDCVEVSEEQEADIRAAIAAGSSVLRSMNGKLEYMPPDPVPFGPQSEIFLAKIRETREVILNRISGIGFAAMVENDAVTTAAVILARQQLLDITSTPSVASAADIDTLKSAVLARYREIVAAAPIPLRYAFDKVGV